MLRASGIVTLTTDFGLVDPFAGLMKGVILSRFGAARIVDLTHGIPPQDVAAAAYWLERSYAWFPPGTVHVAVVDPGVGTERVMVAAQAHGHAFVGPDNGLFASIVASDPNGDVRRLDPRALGLGTPSATFHGRDVFAPVAAELASGRLPLASVGAPCALTVGPLVAPARFEGAGLVGAVVTVDRFGNLLTNVEAHDLARLAHPVVSLGSVALAVGPAGAAYGSVAEGELVALVNAHGTLEVAVRNGNAAARLGVGRGASVVVRSEVP